MERTHSLLSFIEQLRPILALPIRQKFNLEHQFFEEGDVFLKLHGTKEKTFDIDEEFFLNKTLKQFDCHIGGCIEIFTNIQDYEKHYNAAHRHSCHECRKRFPTNRLLEIHIEESHDALFLMLAEKQNMYQCLVDSCDNKFKDAGKRNEHMIKQHQWPSDFRFGHLKNKKPPKASKMEETTSTCQQDPSMETQTSEEATTEMTSKDDLKTRLPIKFAPKIPHHICFGHGVNRGFSRAPRGSKKQHWHQKKSEGMDTSVNIEKLTFKDMQDALP